MKLFKHTIFYSLAVGIIFLLSCEEETIEEKDNSVESKGNSPAKKKPSPVKNKKDAVVKKVTQGSPKSRKKNDPTQNSPEKE